jgi:hypothetical protein
VDVGGVVGLHAGLQDKPRFPEEEAGTAKSHVI